MGEVMKTTVQNFGVLSDGTKVSLFTVKNKRMSFSVTDYGCRITSIVLRDSDGSETDVVLGYSTLEGYIYDTSYFGAFVGRFANRIKNASFTLDGKRFTLDKNDGRNMLHGGFDGWDKKVWKANPALDLNKDGVMQYVMIKGEPGHPDAEARTTYSVKELNDKGIKTEKLQEDTGMWDAAQAKDKMDAWLAGPTGSKIEVVISNNDGMALGALEAMKAHQKKLPVFGVDALQEALTLIESGELTGTVLNDGTNQAKAVLELSRNLANGKDPLEGTSWKLEDKAVRVPYVGVDKENLAQFKK